MMRITKQYNDLYLLLATLFVWTIYAAFYDFFQNVHYASVIPGYMSLVGEAGLDFVAAGFAFVICKKTEVNKTFFMLLCVSLLAATLSDFIYNEVLNIHRITAFGIATDSLWDVPFAIFLTLQALAWGVLFFQNSKIMAKKFSVYIPYLIVGVTIFCIFTYGINWKINQLSTLGWYENIDTMMEALGFIFASFCLIQSRENGIKYLATGYLLVISSDFIIRYSVVTASLQPGNPMETTWTLGLLIMILGLFASQRIDLKKNY
ncbi:MAG: hypothetical protein JXR42_01645 [Gammaproteobacteria bacterium]|nr:hypothetical protein [Gammaproteobacteria bacterium]